MTLSRDVPLIPENSALLFVDVQNFSANRQGAEFKDLPDAEFKEKYCHFSGEESNGQTTFSRPILKKNWTKAKKAHNF